MVQGGGILPPRPLGDAGQDLWDRVQSEYAVVDAGGIELLCLACAALDRAEGCAARIEADGLVISSANGSARDHVLLRHEIANRALAARLLQRLGLDVEPVGRTGAPERLHRVDGVTTRRTPIHRGHRPRLTPEMRAKAERLLQLSEDHADAIRGGSQAFYEDGRHGELVELIPEVYPILGIKPWDDDLAMLRAALGLAAAED